MTLKHEKCKVKVSKGVSVLVVLVKSDGGAGYEDGETSGPRIRATGSLSLPRPRPSLITINQVKNCISSCLIHRIFLFPARQWRGPP